MINPKRDFNLKRKIKNGVSFALSGTSWLSNPLSNSKNKKKDLSLKRFLELTPDAVIGISKEGHVQLWNKSAENLFGWTSKEAVGRLMGDMIIPREFRTLHANGMKRMVETGESRISGKHIDLQAINKKGKSFPIKLFISPNLGNSDISFVGFAHENSKELEIQKELNLKLVESEVLSNLMTLVTREFSLNEVLQKSLNLLSNSRSWEIGHIYQKHNGLEGHRSLGIWENTTGLSIQGLADNSEFLNSKTSPWCEGMGACLDEISWVENVQNLKTFERYGFLREFGLKGAVTLPIKVNGETQFIMEFFSLESVDLTPNALKFLSDVSEYIGKAISLKI